MRQQILAGIFVTLTASASHASLVGRAPLTPDATDYQAYYDTRLGITWLADANYPLNSDFPLPENGALMTWIEAQAWLGQLNTAAHLGGTGWRLPGGSPLDEMADLFFETLGNRGGFDPTAPCNLPPYPVCLTNTGPFQNIELFDYWTGTLEFDGTVARDFYWAGGYAGNGNIYTKRKYVWAVHDGDPAPVPLPAAAWLIAPAFGLLGPWVRRRLPNAA